MRQDTWIYFNKCTNGDWYNKAFQTMIYYNKVQELINDFTSEAGLMKHFMMHCFHCGGAQYWLMHAPIGQCWPLTMVRWWGGWVVSEHVSHSHDCYNMQTPTSCIVDMLDHLVFFSFTYLCFTLLLTPYLCMIHIYFLQYIPYAHPLHPITIYKIPLTLLYLYINWTIR